MNTTGTFKPRHPLDLAGNLGPAYGVTGSRLEHGLSAGVREQAMRKVGVTLAEVAVDSEVEVERASA